MARQALEERADGSHVRKQIKVKNDDTVQVRYLLVQPFDNLVDNLLARRGVASSRHAVRTLEQLWPSAKGRKRCGAFIGRNLVIHELKERKIRSLPKESKISSTQNGLLAVPEAKDFRFFIVDSAVDPLRLFRNGGKRGGVRRGRVLDQTHLQVLVQDGVHLFSQNGIEVVRLRCDRGASLWQVDAGREQRTCAKVR